MTSNTVAASAAEAAGLSTLPILVVDDDPDIQTVLRLVLEGEGYSVALASNGQEALAHLATGPLALILLDLNMPVMSGWDCYPQLAQQCPRIPVVIMTAGASARDEATLLGADGCLPKPFDLEDLLRTVARFAA